jgi:hypothetical protein
MTRWSISNLLLPVSREQFTTLTEQFKQAAEHSFGGPCKLEIHAMNAVKKTSSFMHDDWIMEAMAEENKRRTVFETDDPAKLTAHIWNRAVYVEVSVEPVNEQSAPMSAWGHAEFKGSLPRQATFYLQPDDATAMKSMIGQNPGRLSGDGYTSNTDIPLLSRFVA